MKQVKNYYELLWENKEYQEKMSAAEGEELKHLQEEYEEWKKENDIREYTRVWNHVYHDICPMCEKNPCECQEEDEKIVKIIEQRDKEDNGVRYSLEDVKESLKEEREE